MHASRHNFVASIAAVATALGVSLLATACGGGGGKGDFSNAALVTLNTKSVPAGATGQAYATQLTADFPHPPGQFIVTAGRLPPGVEMNNVTGEITGFPRQLGRFNFDISARDGLDPALPPGRDSTFSEAVRSFAIDVGLGAPNILPQVPNAAQYRKSYLYQIDVAGGTPPYVFTLEGGTLPTGIALSSDGKLGNFPTQANVAAGVPFPIDVKVTDANNLSDTAHFDLNVVVLPLIILTSNINEAALNFPYDVELELASTGGGQPITWSQVAPIAGEVSLGSIGMEITPDGHVRNAIGFTGPTSLGVNLFTIQVTDEAGQVTSRQYSLKVNPGPVLTSISPARASLPGPYTVTGSNFQIGAILVFKPGLTEVTVTPSFISPTQLRFNTAPGAPGGGAVPVKVVNPDGGSFTKPAAFVFTATTIAFGTKGFMTSNLSSTGLDCADVNGDGWPDVVHCGAASMQSYSGSPVSTSPGVILHRNLGTSPVVTFASQTLESTNAYDCKFADLNSDGKPDIVVLGQTQIRTWLNGVSGNPLGTFSAGPTSTHATGFSYPSQMTVGKLNSDGIPDLAFGVSYIASSGTTGRVYTMNGNGAGGFTLVGQATSTLNYNGGCIGIPSINCGDSDGDGRDEIMAGRGLNPGYGSSNAVFYNAPDANGNLSTWGNRGIVVTPTYYWTTTGVAVGDFMGTGTDAIVSVVYGSYVAYAPGQALIVYSGTGYNTTTVLPGTTNMSKSVGAIDANFDSRIDWAVSTQPSYIEVWNGTTQASVLTINAGVGSPSVSSPITGYIASGDLDRDGRDDLVVSTSSWICEGMGSYNGSTYAQGISADGGSKGFVWYLNTSN